MKNTRLYIAVAAAMGLSACADDNVADFSIDKPEEVILTEQLNSYGTLLNYVSPSFKIGNTIDAQSLTQNGAATTLVTNNFNEVTLSGVFSHSKRVNGEGVVESKIEDVDKAVEFAKEHNISVYGHSLLSTDVNSGYLNIKFPVVDDGTEEVQVFEPIDLLANFDDEDFAEGTLPKGWVCDQGGEIHEYPNAYGSGARTFIGFGGYHGKGLYWRVQNAEFGSQSDNTLTLKAGEYKVEFAVAAWKGTPNYMVEVLDASDNSIASSDVFLAAPNADGSKAADLSSSEKRELAFVVEEEGNYKIRFVNKTDGFSEFLLLHCKVDGTQSAGEVELVDFLASFDEEDFAEGTLPKGWACDQGGEIHDYPNSYGSGARTFIGFDGYHGKGLYWRVQNAEFGSQSDFPLELAAGDYNLEFAVAAWKGAPNYRVDILDASNVSVASSEVFLAAPNADGNKFADLSSSEKRVFSFSVAADGNYKIRFVNSTEGFSEFLLLHCQMEITKNAPKKPDFTDPEVAKQIADKAINDYVTAMVTDNPGIAAWTIAENPVSTEGNFWYKVFGYDYVGIAAKYARAANSSAKFFVSESNLGDADVRAALIDIAKSSSDIDGINVAVAIDETTDLSTVMSDLAATGKLIRLYVLSFDTPENLSKALAAYKTVPDAQRYGISFANTSGIWSDNYNRTAAYKILADALM